MTGIFPLRRLGGFTERSPPQTQNRDKYRERGRPVCGQPWISATSRSAPTELGRVQRQRVGMSSPRNAARTSVAVVEGIEERSDGWKEKREGPLTKTRENRGGSSILAPN